MRLQNMGRKLALFSTAVILSAAAVMTGWAATRLGTVSEVYWNDDDDNDNKMTEAVWEPVEDAYQYEIALYRDESRVGSVKVSKNKSSYNLKRKMDKEGEYTFRVRALAKEKDKKFSNGSWSDYSDGIYITEARAELNKSGKTIDTSLGGPGTPQKEETGQAADSQNAGSGFAPAPAGVWQQDYTGWWYRKADGTYPVNGWFQDPADGKYYMFDARGYMQTGWVVWEGKYYYCDEAGSPSGAMVTGELTIDGILYHFDDSGAAKEDVILPDKALSEN